MSAISAPKVYGKLNIAVNNDGSDVTANADNSNDIDLISNASRLGFKGKVDMKNGLTAVRPFFISTLPLKPNLDALLIRSMSLELSALAVTSDPSLFTAMFNLP